MADPQRLQTILSDFQKRMRKNGVTNKAIWTAFTSLPTISPVQFTRRLNSYGITVTNREVSLLWKYVGIKTNSMNYEDFVKIMQASPSSIPASAKPASKRTPRNASPYANERQLEDDDNNYRGGTSNAVARPRLGRRDDDPSLKKERLSARPSTTATASNSKPHVKIDSRFMNPKKQGEKAKRPNYNVPDDNDSYENYKEVNNEDDLYDENLYNEVQNQKGGYEPKRKPAYLDEGYDDNYDDVEGSVASSKYSRGKGSENYDDENDVDYSSYKSKQSPQSQKSAKYSPPKRSNNSGIDDEILNQGTYDSADDNEDNYYPNRNQQYNEDDELDDDDYASQHSRKSQQSRKNASRFNEDDDYASQYSRKSQQSRKSASKFNEDDDYASQYSRKSQRNASKFNDDDDDASQYSRKSQQSQRNASKFNDDDDDASQYSRKSQQSRKSASRFNEDDDYASQYSRQSQRNASKFNDDDDKNFNDIDNDDDFEDKRFSKNESAKSSARKSQEPEIFSRIPSSNSPDSPNRNPTNGGRRNLDPMIFGSRNVSSAASKSSRASMPNQYENQDEEEEKFKGAEKVNGISLKKLASLISEKVYNSYPNGKACYNKWRGIHNGIEAEDIRNGLAKDSKVLISLDDANKIISKYGGPLTLSAFSRLLSDGTRFAEEEKSGQQELTSDEEAILKIAHSVKGNGWEDMIYNSPTVVDIVDGFAELGIVVNEDDIRVLTQKIGKTGLVNAIRANM